MNHLKIIRLIRIITPTRLLPKGTKNVDGVRKPLEIQERRELLERNLAHHFDRILQHSPLRRSIKLYKRYRLKRKQDQFYCLMGKIALTHAAIEQDLKNTLIVDWEVPDILKEKGQTVSIGKLFGERLKKRFFKEIKKLYIPDHFLEEYKTLYDEFWNLSIQRNEVIKALYSFNTDTAEISQVHEKNFRKYDGAISYEEMLKAWLPSVNLDCSEELLNNLTKLRENFTHLRHRIFIEKLNLATQLGSEKGKIYPEYIFKNPYLYKAEIST
jgi:hypothetical protein